MDEGICILRSKRPQQLAYLSRFVEEHPNKTLWFGQVDGSLKGVLGGSAVAGLKVDPGLQQQPLDGGNDRRRLEWSTQNR
jgi:hypothetical protein